MMKSRRDLLREYKERPKPAGVFQIKNSLNEKAFLGSSLNLEGPLNMHRFMLKSGHHANKALQQDWNELGEDKFVFEILQEVKSGTTPISI